MPTVYLGVLSAYLLCVPTVATTHEHAHLHISFLASQSPPYRSCAHRLCRRSLVEQAALTLLARLLGSPHVSASFRMTRAAAGRHDHAKRKPKDTQQHPQNAPKPQRALTKNGNSTDIGHAKKVFAVPLYPPLSTRMWVSHECSCADDGKETHLLNHRASPAAVCTSPSTLHIQPSPTKRIPMNNHLPSLATHSVASSTDVME